ncbi:MAG: hypothetical protein AAB875_05615 [Patescibacteria group bacterium]
MVKHVEEKEGNGYSSNYCTKRKKGCKCSQKGYTTGEGLEEQVRKEIEKITILPEFKDWALEILRESNNQEIEERTKIYESQHKTLSETQGQLDTLTRMRYRGLIEDDEFSRERKELQNQIARIKERMKETESRAEKWIDLTEKTFEFACYAFTHFNNGDIQTRREILNTLGQNFSLKDQKLQVIPNEWLVPIIEKYPAIEKKYQSVRTDKKLSTARRNELLGSLRPLMRGLVDDVGTTLVIKNLA